MSSQPIAIPTAAPRAYAVEGLVDIHSTPLTHSQRSSILPSRKLYVPVHKRSSSASSVSSSVSSRASSTFSSADSSSSRSDSSCATSPALSVSSLEADEHEKEVAATAASATTAATGIASSTTSSPTTPTRTLPPFVYSPSELLALATSTHSRIAPSTRDALRANVPEIVMNRQQRKSIAFKAAHGGPSAVPVTVVSKHYQFNHASGNTNGGAGKRAGGNGGARSRSTHSRSSSESCCSSAQSDCSCWRSSPQ